MTKRPGYRNTVALKLSDADLMRVRFAAELSGKGIGAVLRNAAIAYLDAAGIPRALSPSNPQEPVTNA